MTSGPGSWRALVGILALVLISLMLLFVPKIDLADSPQITKIIAPPIWCHQECLVANIRIIGSGFSTGQTITSGHGKILQARFIDKSQILFSLAFDISSLDTGAVTITIVGHGRPSSSSFSFPGNMHAFKCISSLGECFLLDRENGLVRIAGGIGVDRRAWWNRNCFVGASLATDFTVDPKNGMLLMAMPYGVLKMRSQDCRIVEIESFDPGFIPMGFPDQGPSLSVYGTYQK